MVKIKSAKAQVENSRCSSCGLEFKNYGGFIFYSLFDDWVRCQRCYDEAGE